MFGFSVGKNMKKKDIIREIAIGKVTTHLYLALIVKKLKFSID
jgi:hypothetical protein